MKKISALLLASILAFAVTACGKTEEKKEEAPPPKAEVSNPYAVQIKVMDRARDLKAESEKKLAEQKAREAAMAGDEAARQ